MADLTTMLKVERQRLETEQVALQEEIRQRADRLVLVKDRLDHVKALLEREPVNNQGESSRIAASQNTARNICDLAVEILHERNSEPMYYKDLAQEVVRRGGILNGATPWATLTARMVQDERFVRPTAKGFYALRRDYPNARNVGARLKGSRRRRRS